MSGNCKRVRALDTVVVGAKQKRGFKLVGCKKCGLPAAAYKLIDTRLE